MASTRLRLVPSGARPGERPGLAYLYILPGFLIYALFVLAPIAQTVGYSFSNWNGISPPEFIGFENYARLVQDPLVRIALRNNLTLLGFYTVFPIALALLFTALLTRRRIRGMSFFRAGLFVPQVMSMVVVGVVWRWIYNPAFGPLNQLLRAVGLEDWAKPWLGDFQFALPAVGMVGTWVGYGFAMVLFIAGVQRLDEDLYDAAKLDGAGEFEQFKSITLPGLRPEITIALVTTLIAALRTFDLVFILTDGGPANRTLVVALQIYRNAFSIGEVGYASAIAVVLAAIILVVSFSIITLRMRAVADS
ncbi:MAG: sugar ABC transporter permease [Chloroflexota bacterium]|nr:sugar ABC transporter permease [Chloroflexota bacterium]